ncbi:MAG: hypothetical protein SF029_16730 [bacterium]|nr:hypothetical protein [bacterium]
MDTSNALLVYLVFGPAFVLAGLQSFLSGEMKIPRTRPPRSVEGGAVHLLGLIYLLWGMVVCVMAVQVIQQATPTLFDSVQAALRLGQEAVITAFLVVNFSLILMPAILDVFTPRTSR